MLHFWHCFVRTVCNNTTLELLHHTADAVWDPGLQEFELKFDTFGPYDDDDDEEWLRSKVGSSNKRFEQAWIPAGYSTTRRTDSWDEFRHAASRDGRPAEGSSSLEVVQTTTNKRTATSSRGRHLHSGRRKQKHHHDKRSKRRKSTHTHRERQDAEHQERKKATKTHHVVPTVDDGSKNATENSGLHEVGGAAGRAGGENNELHQARPTSRKEKDVQLFEKTTDSHDGETPKSSAEMRHTQDDEPENRNESRAERGGSAASDRPGQNTTRGMSSQLALKNKNAPAARKKRHGKRRASASGVGKRSGGRGAEDRSASIRERRGDRFEFLQTRADEKKAELMRRRSVVILVPCIRDTDTVSLSRNRHLAAFSYINFFGIRRLSTAFYLFVLAVQETSLVQLFLCWLIYSYNMCPAALLFEKNNCYTCALGAEA